VAAAKGEQDKAKKKAVKSPRYPLAPRRAQAMLSPRGLLYRPHSLCKEEWAFVTPIPDLPAALRHKRAERHRGRWYFRRRYAEQHKSALAGELHKKLAGQCRRRKEEEKWALSWLAPFYLPPASIGLRTFRGPSANAGWAVWRIDSRNVRQPSFLETL